MQKVRGTKDILPEENLLVNEIISHAKEVARRYNFGEISTPIFEFSSLFERNLGDESDIVSKEIYKFEDKSGNIWVGTNNTGLYRFDGKTFTDFSETASK